MKRLRNCILALLMGLSAPVLIWVGAGAAILEASRRYSKAKAVGWCSIDSDCPPGFVCEAGRCVSVKQGS